MQKVCLEHTLLVADSGLLSPEWQKLSQNFVPGYFWLGLALHVSPQGTGLLLAEIGIRAPLPAWLHIERQDNVFDTREVYLQQLPEHTLFICLSTTNPAPGTHPFISPPPSFVENLVSASTVSPVGPCRWVRPEPASQAWVYSGRILQQAREEQPVLTTEAQSSVTCPKSHSRPRAGVASWPSGLEQPGRWYAF